MAEGCLLGRDDSRIERNRRSEVGEINGMLEILDRGFHLALQDLAQPEAHTSDSLGDITPWYRRGARQHLLSRRPGEPCVFHHMMEHEPRESFEQLNSRLTSNRQRLYSPGHLQQVGRARAEDGKHGLEKSDLDSELERVARRPSGDSRY